MSTNEIHLFVFEGDKAEPKYVKMLERNFLNSKISVQCVYDAEIYQLYRQLKNDDFDIDIVNLIKERTEENARILAEFDRDSFAAIYLFFDYDAHSSLADDRIIQEMLDYFDNETERGMLYLSYPMVESIRHFRDMDNFKHLVAKCKRSGSFDHMKCPRKHSCHEVEACIREPHYKTRVAQEARPQLANINSYNEDVWKELIRAHLFKMNYIVNDDFSMPSVIVSQRVIFDNQMTKYIEQNCPKVAVLSAFPVWVLDYFGVKKISERLGMR